MRTFSLIKTALVLGVLAVMGGLLYRLPPVQQRLAWRIDFGLTYLRGVINPVEAVPTALPQPEVYTLSKAASPTSNPTGLPAVETILVPTPSPSATPIPTLAPLPAAIALPSPKFEKQDINNCGPASLAMHLRYFGWEGDQFEIANLLKPQRDDRNVNVEELVYYVRTRAGWLNAEYRVGGDIQILKRFLAAEIPVMVEESFRFDEPFWPNDDLWAGHYLLLTGYDDSTETFVGQDSFYGADRSVAYAKLDEYWQTFNRVYIIIYLPHQTDTVKAILGSDWDVAANRQKAMEKAEAEIQADPENAFAWFNLGSNLVYFERYVEAGAAYDSARNLGLPQRMLRYQFGPFFAYFHSGRTEDLLALTKYALQRTPNAEEALLWNGWALYQQGETTQAIEKFRQALKENPNYQDAKYALDFAGASP